MRRLTWYDMRIEYELTKDDWGAFGEFCARTAPEFLRAARVGVAVGVLSILAVSALLSLELHAVSFLVTGICAAVGWAVVWPRRLVSNARTHMRGRQRACLTGVHAMETTPEALNAKCDITQSSVKWMGVSHIAKTARHVFIILSGGQGFVIPKERICSGNLDEFIREAEEYLAMGATHRSAGT